MNCCSICGPPFSSTKTDGASSIFNRHAKGFIVLIIKGKIMSRKIQISDDIYKHLEQLAEGFDTPSNVIQRLIKFWELNHPHPEGQIIDFTEENQKLEKYSLYELNNRDLTKTKPDYIYLGNAIIKTSNWADLCVKTLSHLNELGLLTHRHLPIFNHAGNNKYFVNTSPEHKIDKKDGLWKKIADSIFVDVKYNANIHIKNLIFLFNELGLGHMDIKISYHNPVVDSV
jgi:hypothetical protein